MLHLLLSVATLQCLLLAVHPFVLNLQPITTRITLCRHAQSLSMSSLEPQNRAPNKRDRQWSSVMKDIEFVRSIRPAETTIDKDPWLPQIECIVLAADDRKAGYMKVLRVSHLTDVTSFVVIVEANSKPQSQAIVDLIELKMHQTFGLDTMSTEGVASSGWMLLDYGPIFVHIMTPQMRNFYKIEKKWKDAEELDISYLLQREMPTDGGFINDSDSGSTDVDEDDPFWK